MTMVQHFATNDGAPIAVLPALAEPSQADETNHRVANSLQLLAAIVSVEARRMADPVAADILDMTMGRITAIAGVHRLLYQTRTAATIDLGAYLDDLGEQLEQGCANPAAGRHVRVIAEAIPVLPEDATAIGVIVSELVTNACKYAYPAGQAGDVHVTLYRLPSGGYRLAVLDRGRGMAPASGPQGEGLGGRLIAMMASRLGASFGWTDAQPGTCFTLSVTNC
jgi:two-component sensor histidine kinase